MKRKVIITIVFLISCLLFLLFSSNKELVKKKEDIVKQAKTEYVEDLYVFTDSPVPSVENRFDLRDEVGRISSFTDEYALTEIGRYDVSLYAIFPASESLWNPIHFPNEIILKDEIAYYDQSVIEYSEIGIKSVVEQAILFKDNISYFFAYTYALPIDEEITFDFIHFLEKNLVRIGDI